MSLISSLVSLLHLLACRAYSDRLARLIAVAAARWRIEEDHQMAKQRTRSGRRAGHPLEVLAPLDRDLPAGLHLPQTWTPD
jgi:hypothetical protein